MRAVGRGIYEAKMARTFTFKKIEKEEEIINLDLKGLQAGLREGLFTSEDLVNVFGRRCYTIGRMLNLTTFEYFDWAFKVAQEKD